MNDEIKFEYKRPLVVSIQIGCDDMSELGRVLDQLSLDILIGDLRVGSNTTSAGWSSSHHISVTETPGMTGDIYRQLLTEWSEARRAPKEPE